MLRNADGGVRFSGKKRYEGVRFDTVISITMGWVGGDPVSRARSSPVPGVVASVL